MSARLASWLAVVAGLAGAVAILVWTAFGAGGDSDPRPAGSTPVSGVAWVSPRAHFVGDRVAATLELTVDPTLTDPASVVVSAGFRPYTRVGPIGVERHDVDGSTRIRYTYALQCIDRACIDRVAGHEFAFGAATVQYASESVGQGTIAVDWPELTVSSRLGSGDLAAGEFRADADAPPAAEGGISPGLLGWLLAGAAAVLVLAVAGTAAVWLRRRMRPKEPSEVAVTELDPLDRALARVGAALDEGEPERRAALDELARALDANGGSELAPVARRLAWSRAAPDEAAIAELVGAAGGRETPVR